MARISRYIILSALGGFLGWLVVEPFDYLTPPGDPSMGYGQILLLGALIGLFIGTGLGVAEALSGVSPRDAVKSMVLGALIGVAGGMLGLAFGNAFYGFFHALAGDRSAPSLPPNVVVPTGPPKFVSFLFDLFGRSIGWALIGLFIGISQGLATESPKKMVNGAVGGFFGGAVGGFTFQVLRELNGTQALAIPAEFMRLIGFTVTAGAIGLFIGFIEELTKQAWLVHLKGRNEGREFLVFKPETVVGRDELVDVPVFGDPDVEPRHFVIKANERRHTLIDMNTVDGTSVNGQKVQQQALRDGDIIQIGMTKFLFRDKATRSIIPRQTESYAAGPQIPTSSHVCPFCGGIKDASGNCSCSVGANAPQNQDMTVMADNNATVVQPIPAQQTMPIGETVAPSDQPRLVAVSGPYAGQTYTLPAGEMTIGRQADRNVSLANDNTVSRQHARITNEGGRFVLYDMGSANGTHVNGTRITQQTLNNGDMVQIGSTKFRFEG